MGGSPGGRYGWFPAEALPRPFSFHTAHHPWPGGRKLGAGGALAGAFAALASALAGALAALAGALAGALAALAGALARAPGTGPARDLTLNRRRIKPWRAGGGPIAVLAAGTRRLSGPRIPHRLRAGAGGAPAPAGVDKPSTGGTSGARPLPSRRTHDWRGGGAPGVVVAGGGPGGAVRPRPPPSTEVTVPAATLHFRRSQCLQPPLHLQRHPCLQGPLRPGG